MLELFNSEIEELRAMNQYLRTYIDSCHKESERCAVYPEHSTEYFNNFENITANSYSVTPQKKKNGREEYCQENHKIHFNKMKKIRVQL